MGPCWYIQRCQIRGPYSGPMVKILDPGQVLSTVRRILAMVRTIVAMLMRSYNSVRNYPWTSKYLEIQLEMT